MKQNEDSLLREKLKEYFGFSSFNEAEIGRGLDLLSSFRTEIDVEPVRH